jgi:hypothetical protein
MISEKTVQDLKDKLDLVLEQQNYQLDRGFIHARQDAIRELLMDINSEILVALSKNNESDYR